MGDVEKLAVAAAAQARVQVAQEVARQAVEERAEAFRGAHDSGYSWREIGKGLSPVMTAGRVEAASLSAEERRRRRER